MSEAMRPVHVMMADDDADDRELVRLAFEELGWPGRIAFAENGVDLLDQLHARMLTGRLPRVILLDLNMPRLDGREALAAMKANATLAAIPVVVLSTSKTHEDQQACTRLGAAAFLTKPSTFDALQDLVRSLDAYLDAAPEATDRACAPGPSPDRGAFRAP